MFNYLLKRLALFLCAAGLLAITTGFIFIDILVLNNGISETSVTELGQEIIVAMISLFFLLKLVKIVNSEVHLLLLWASSYAS